MDEYGNHLINHIAKNLQKYIGPWHDEPTDSMKEAFSKYCYIDYEVLSKGVKKYELIECEYKDIPLKLSEYGRYTRECHEVLPYQEPVPQKLDITPYSGFYPKEVIGRFEPLAP